MPLTGAQRQIIDAPAHSNLRFLGCSSPSKQRALIERLNNLLSLDSMEDVLVLAFTEKEVAEFKDALTERRLEQRRARVVTFDELALAIIQNPRNLGHRAKRKRLCLTLEERAILFTGSLDAKGINVNDFLLGLDRPEVTHIDDLLTLFSEIKRNDWDQQTTINRYGNAIWEAFEDYQRLLSVTYCIDTEDLYLETNRLLVKKDWASRIVRGLYPYVLVLRAQNLDPLQYTFLKLLFAERTKSLMFEGDLRATYHTPWAKPSIFETQFVEEYNPLDITYEEGIEDAQFLKGKSTSVDLTVNSFVSTQDEAEAIVKTIQKCLAASENPNETLEETAVVARSQYLFRPLKALLKKEGIDYVTVTHNDHYEPVSPIGKALEYVLRLKSHKNNYHDAKSFSQLLGVECPTDWSKLNDLRLWSMLAEASKSPYKVFYKRLVDALAPCDLEEVDLPAIITPLLEAIKTAAVEPLFKRHRDELSIAFAELSDMYDLWAEFKARYKYHNSLPVFLNILDMNEITQRRPRTGLTICTPKAFDLKKNVVFVMGLTDNDFPSAQAISRHDLERERELFLTALGSAGQKLYLSYPKTRQMPWGEVVEEEPSRFLETLTKVKEGN